MELLMLDSLCLRIPCVYRIYESISMFSPAALLLVPFFLFPLPLHGHCHLFSCLQEKRNGKPRINSGCELPITLNLALKL